MKGRSVGRMPAWSGHMSPKAPLLWVKRGEFKVADGCEHIHHTGGFVLAQRGNSIDRLKPQNKTFYVLTLHILYIDDVQKQTHFVPYYAVTINIFIVLSWLGLK